MPSTAVTALMPCGSAGKAAGAAGAVWVSATRVIRDNKRLIDMGWGPRRIRAQAKKKPNPSVVSAPSPARRTGMAGRTMLDAEAQSSQAAAATPPRFARLRRTSRSSSRRGPALPGRQRRPLEGERRSRNGGGPNSSSRRGPAPPGRQRRPLQGERRSRNGGGLIHGLELAMPERISFMAASGPSQPCTLTHLPASRSL